MPRRHIRRGDDRRGREDLQYRCNDIVKLCGVTRRSRGKEGAVCGKYVEAIQASAQRKRENGDTARVRFGVGTRGEDGVICYAFLRMRLLSISCAEGFVVISSGQVDYDKSGWQDD
jgi:hypothetical protein